MASVPADSMTIEALAFAALALLVHSVFENAHVEIRGSAGVVPVMLAVLVALSALYPMLVLTDPLHDRWDFAHRVYGGGFVVMVIGLLVSDFWDRLAWRMRRS